MVDPTRPQQTTADAGGAGFGPGADPRSGSNPGDGGRRHLDLDALNAVLDGALDPADRAAATAHLAACTACAADLAELRATAVLLRELPQYRPRRSFTLGPEHANRPRPLAETGTGRFLPSLPALRAATLAVAALLLLAVVGEWALGRSPAPTVPRQPVPAPAPTVVLDEAPAVQEAAPAAEGARAEPAGLERAIAPGLSGADQEAAGDGAAGDTAIGDASGEEVDEAAGGVGTGAASRTSQGADGEPPAAAARAAPSPWRLAQIGLGLTLLWLLASLAGLGVVRRLQGQP
jgi:anti-sigma factor RsiW